MIQKYFMTLLLSGFIYKNCDAAGAAGVPETPETLEIPKKLIRAVPALSIPSTIDDNSRDDTPRTKTFAAAVIEQVRTSKGFEGFLKRFEKNLLQEGYALRSTEFRARLAFSYIRDLDLTSDQSESFTKAVSMAIVSGAVDPQIYKYIADGISSGLDAEEAHAKALELCEKDAQASEAAAKDSKDAYAQVFGGDSENEFGEDLD